jgi:acetyltransferase
MIGDPLDSLFTPRTVAIVGASDNERKKGSLVLRNVQAGFAGEIFPVHPSAKTVGGLRSYRSIAEIPLEIDLLIPVIPGPKLMELMRDCPPDRVKVVLALPAGFGEVAPHGQRVEQELVAIARSKGMRVVGPNSLGMMNCGLGLNASLAPGLPGDAGGFSCVTQSGGFGMSIYMYGVDHGLGVAKFCDLGNTSDISVAEVIELYRNDPDTAIIGAFLEAYPDGLDEQIVAAAEVKPLIITTLGRTDPGQRASRAHLGLDTGHPGPAVTSADGHTIAAQTGLEMLDIAKALAWQPVPNGSRVAILTGSGGLGAELTDLCVEHGLEVPELSPTLQERLRPHLPSYASVVNPVDLTPAWLDYPEMYPPLMKTLLGSEEVDMVIITVIDVATTVEPLMAAISETVAEHGAGADRPKPVLVYWAAPPGFRHHRQLLQATRVPCYPSTLSTVRVAAAISQHGRLSRPVTD